MDLPMMDEFTEVAPREEGQPDRLLVSSDKPLDLWMKTCPVARTVEGWSVALQTWVVIANTCNRWSCPICGRHKVQKYARMVAEACPNRFITLTCNPARHANPRAAYDETRRQIAALTTKLRRRYEEFEFFRVLEVTKKGWPHYHLITRCPYIPQAELSELWNQLTGAPIVDVRAMHKKTNAYWYVVKYLGKQAMIPWTNRRAAWTRGFFPKTAFEPGPSLEIPVLHFQNAHPADHIRWWFEGCVFERYSRNCWIKVASE